MRNEHKAVKDWLWVQDHQLRNACPQSRESCHSWLSLHTSLIPVQEGLSVTWGSGKDSGPLSTCMDSVDRGSAQDWRGRRLSVWVALTEQLTSEEVCWCQGHVPAVHRAAIPLRRGRHWCEPRDLLKASSYCKLAQRSLQSKKSLWFCIWHTYAPSLLGTSPSASECISTLRKVSRNIDPSKEGEKSKKSSCYRTQANSTSSGLFKIHKQ